ncbi:unnamed protein product [Schistosoma haematobium]|nr:unnamed protein product [Schistosoma haematobium]
MMTGDHIKVIYFNGRGRAESIRMTLVAAGVNYEDERISFQDWPKIKPTIPGGRLPAVKITDNHGHVKWMVESLAIARYMAKKHHMMGGTEEEYYNVEKLIGQAEDLEHEYYKTLMKPEEEKQKIIKEILNGKVPVLLDLTYSFGCQLNYDITSLFLYRLYPITPNYFNPHWFL